MRDTLLLPPDATLDAIATVGATPPNGWMWKTKVGGLTLQQRVDQSPHVVPLPDFLGLVTALHASSDGRRLAVAGRARSAPDSTTIIVMNVDGSSPVVIRR